MTPSNPVLWANLSTLQLEAGRGGNIFEDNYTETQQWLHTESWILEVRKSISTNKMNIANLEPEVSTQRMHDPCLMTQLALEGEFTTSELRAINRCCMSKDIFFIRNIINHQGTNLQKPATDTVTNLNRIHEFNFPRKHRTTT